MLQVSRFILSDSVGGVHYLTATYIAGLRDRAATYDALANRRVAQWVTACDSALMAWI